METKIMSVTLSIVKKIGIHLNDGYRLLAFFTKLAAGADIVKMDGGNT